MNYKIDNLYDRIYVGFIRGEYGPPKIPTKNEVLSKIEETTTTDYVPITKNVRLSDIDINKIRESFSNIIDDIGVLFGSVESESEEVLDQLTNSLKEHNGVKRELRLIKTSAEDIAAGKLGDEYLKYNFTETFDDSTNINMKKSDPVNFDAGLFTINKDTSNFLNMNHYYGSKLEFNVVENFSQIVEYGYVGGVDAASIFDQTDPRALTYRIITSDVTPLKVAVTLQLTQDSTPVEINSVSIDLDSDIAKGFIRLYYKDSFEWKDVKTNSIQEIKNNKVVFNFPSVNTSFIKIEFIKESPDVFATNSYYYVINNIGISKGSSKRTATLYSKPVIIEGYSKENPVIATVSVSGDYDIPKNCDVKVYISPDIRISGSFLNSDGFPVNFDSSDVYRFDNTYSGMVFLSEIWEADDRISGVLEYKGLDFNWKTIKLSDSTGEKTPDIIDLASTSKNNKLDNSLFLELGGVVFGDDNYTGVYSLSGWVNTDNPDWATLAPLVTSGIYVSGVNVAVLSGIAWENIEDSSGNLHPDILNSPLYSGQWIGYGSGVGYPFAYTSGDYKLKFGDYTQFVNGWWRPYSHIVTPTGLDPNYTESGFLRDSYNSFLPDFNFNNIPFYKIYKFGATENLIDQSIRLYTYQERPVNNSNDYFPCSFVWKYKSEWIDQIGVQINSYDNLNATTWDGYVLSVPTGLLRSNEEYTLNAISDLKIHNTNSVLDNSEYQVLYDGPTITGILLKGLTSRTGLTPQGVTFDYKYQYKVKNEYQSTWTGYIIILPGTYSPSITIPNIKLVDRNINLIQSIVIENIDTGQITTLKEDTGGIFTVAFPNQDDKVESHYKITIFCASDTSTGFCALNWVPFESTVNGTITVSPGIKIVYRLDPIKIVGLDTLIYDTPMNNNGRAAIYNDNGSKYIVVKCPSRDTVPGYYFDSINKEYISDSNKMIDNKGHWIRRHIERVDGVINSYYYTTGSMSGEVYKKDFTTKDETWNGGVTVVDFPNYTGISQYTHHSTYGYPINIDRNTYQTFILYTGDIDTRSPVVSGEYVSGVVGSADWIAWLNRTGRTNDLHIYYSSNKVEIEDFNRGFLYYGTAENLPSYYSISYRLSNSSSDLSNRFMYKIELLSDDEGSVVPKIRSIRFMLNGDEDAQ